MTKKGSIWANEPDLGRLNVLAENTLHAHLGIRCTDIGDDYIEATMPVDHRTVQPFRILHGGASVVLAESLGSMASTLCIENPDTHTAVGVEINANHLRSVAEGATVTGRVTPIRVGRRVQVWNIEIRDDEGRLACISRLTIMIVERSR